MQKLKSIVDSETLCDCIISGMQDNKAKDIVILDLREIESAVTDYFIICSGDSSTQIDGICNSVLRGVRSELHERPWHQEGKGTSEWILLDYINIVVHIFSKEKREFYNIEGLWEDAKRKDIPNLD